MHRDPLWLRESHARAFAFSFCLVNSRNLFLTVLEAGSLRSECQHSQVLVRAHRLDCQALSVFSHGGRGQKSFLGCLS